MLWSSCLQRPGTLMKGSQCSVVGGYHCCLIGLISPCHPAARSGRKHDAAHRCIGLKLLSCWYNALLVEWYSALLCPRMVSPVVPPVVAM
jgi:hypothetical protein